MARDHFIPAAFLGRFSNDKGNPSRHRSMTVMRPGRRRPYQARAESIGFVNDLYSIDFDTSVSQHGARFVDALWADYEARLPTALDMLAEGKCDLDHWINVLVPFVASLLVRDRWYGERLANAHCRDGAADGIEDFVVDHTNLNLNRIIGRNGFMGRLLVSDWVVGTTSRDLCTSDLGYAHLVDQVEHEGRSWDRVSVLVPVSRRILLVIRPEPYLRVLEWHGGQWGRQLNSFDKDTLEAAEVNAMIALYAQDFIAGSKQAVNSIDHALIAKNSPDALQAIQEYWPYRAKTSELAGVWGALRQAVNGLPPSAIGATPLHPMAGITDRLCEGVTTIRANRSGRARLLQEVISLDPLGFLFEW